MAQPRNSWDSALLASGHCGSASRVVVLRPKSRITTLRGLSGATQARRTLPPADFAGSGGCTIPPILDAHFLLAPWGKSAPVLLASTLLPARRRLSSEPSRANARYHGVIAEKVSVRPLSARAASAIPVSGGETRASSASEGTPDDAEHRGASELLRTPPQFLPAYPDGGRRCRTEFRACDVAGFTLHPSAHRFRRGDELASAITRKRVTSNIGVGGRGVLIRGRVLCSYHKLSRSESTGPDSQ
jgi:hypothetical protein